MDPARPAREPVWAELLGRFGIDNHSRTWVTANVEWPAIRRDLDAGNLATVGLVKVVSLDPNLLGHNHQVLGYGYDLDGTNVTLHIYDPNFAGADDVTLAFDTADLRAPSRRSGRRRTRSFASSGRRTKSRPDAVPRDRPEQGRGPRGAAELNDGGCRCPTAADEVPAEPDERRVQVPPVRGRAASGSRHLAGQIGDAQVSTPLPTIGPFSDSPR